MFTFFTKKYFLKDVLEGFVDIHNHILPGIDDGAKNTEESITLIKKMMDLGITQFMPTPHIMQDFYPNTYETIGDAYQKLLETLTPEMLKAIKINPAAEYMIDTHFEGLLGTDNLYPLKGNYILVEISYFQAPINLEAIIFKLKTKGYIPILAHPERYSFYHTEFGSYNKLKNMGCLFQLNLLSLSDHYGKHVEKIAHRLLNEQLIDFVGTDAHNDNHIQKISEIALSKSRICELKKAVKVTNNTFSVI